MVSSDPAPQAPGHLWSLTGLRFIAALAVLGSHVMLRMPAGQVRDVLSRGLTQGFVGVSFFFILSGFILTWSRRDGDTSRQFYRRRFARVMPAYWVALVLAVVANTVFGTAQTASQPLPSFFAIQAWFPDNRIHFGGNTVGWSLSAELFFYASFPLLLVALRSPRARIVMIGMAVIAIFAVPALLSSSDEQSLGYWVIYILPLQRLAEFVVGMGLAHAMRSGCRSPSGEQPASLPPPTWRSTSSRSRSSTWPPLRFRSRF